MSGVSKTDIGRYLGLSLGGAKSDKTSLTVIDYYKKQDKAFVVDVFEAIGPQRESKADAQDELSADQVIFQLIKEHSPGIEVLGADVPLTLPPCLLSCLSSCKGYEKCKKSEVRWMNNQYRKMKKKNTKLKHFTPYTQRPVDLYFRYLFEASDILQDETLGANLAPQAARMQYLKRHIKNIKLIEVWPKLTLFCIHKALKITHNEMLSYRNIENGVEIREKILEQLVERCPIFIYDRDLKKLILNISSFDSFLCGWVSLLFAQEKVVKFKRDLPLESGWVQVPEI